MQKHKKKPIKAFKTGQKNVKNRSELDQKPNRSTWACPKSVRPVRHKPVAPLSAADMRPPIHHPVTFSPFFVFVCYVLSFSKFEHY
jgi:hypothetical protein